MVREPSSAAVLADICRKFTAGGPFVSRRLFHLFLLKIYRSAGLSKGSTVGKLHRKVGEIALDRRRKRGSR
jgi:hypothetical protein